MSFFVMDDNFLELVVKALRHTMARRNGKQEVPIPVGFE